MALALEVISAILGIGGVVGAGIYYLRRAVLNAVSIDQLNAAARMAAEQAATANKAAIAARVARLQEVNAKADSVTTAGDAAALLRQTTGADDPKLN